MEASERKPEFFDRFFAGGVEFNRYAIISAVLLIVGCMSGLTVGYGAIDNLFQLIMVVIPTMATLSLLLGLAPMRYIMTAGIITVIIDTIILLFNLLG
ncbi:MAG: hypothetical protein R3277_00080 [Brumimicrobium sp.]|nr:hypothetical protein [Brumimicrobium sp.]